MKFDRTWWPVAGMVVLGLLLLSACTPLRAYNNMNAAFDAAEAFAADTLEARRAHRLRRRGILDMEVNDLVREGKYTAARELLDANRPNLLEPLADLKKARAALRE